MELDINSSDVQTAFANLFNKINEYANNKSKVNYSNLRIAYNNAYSEAGKFIHDVERIYKKTGYDLATRKGISSFINKVKQSKVNNLDATRTDFNKALGHISGTSLINKVAGVAAAFGAAFSIIDMGSATIDAVFGGDSLMGGDWDGVGRSALGTLASYAGATATGFASGALATGIAGSAALGAALVPTAIILGAIAGGYFGAKAGAYIWDETKDLRGFLQEQIADSLELLADPDTDWGDWDTLSGWVKSWFGLDRDGDAHQYDPLTLDLNGNGIETLAANGHDGALFDHERSGIRTGTGWVHSNDGILVYDRNDDGKINNGGELFGDNTLLKDGSTAAHGFAALAELDENGDGKVDAADSAFKKLGIWRDLNHNGISEEGEISSLEDVRVQSLNLAYKNADQNLGNGNTLAEVGSYTDADGNEHIMGDLQLSADRFHSRFSDSIELTDAQRREVNLGGSGRVRNLREAAAQSSELADALQQYKNAETKEEQLALRDKLLQAWANTDKSRDSIIKISADFAIHTQQDRRRGIGLTPSQIRHMQSIMSRNIWNSLENLTLMGKDRLNCTAGLAFWIPSPVPDLQDSIISTKRRPNTLLIPSTVLTTNWLIASMTVCSSKPACVLILMPYVCASMKLANMALITAAYPHSSPKFTRKIPAKPSPISANCWLKAMPTAKTPQWHRWPSNSCNLPLKRDKTVLSPNTLTSSAKRTWTPWDTASARTTTTASVLAMATMCLMARKATTPLKVVPVTTSSMAVTTRATPTSSAPGTAGTLSTITPPKTSRPTPCALQVRN